MGDLTLPLLVLEKIGRNASEIKKEETRVTLLDLIAFADGPSQSKGASGP